MGLKVNSNRHRARAAYTTNYYCVTGAMHLSGVISKRTKAISSCSSAEWHQMTIDDNFNLRDAAERIACVENPAKRSLFNLLRFSIECTL